MNRAIFALFTIFACAAADNIRDRDYYVAKFYDWMNKFEHLRPANGERFISMLKNFANNDDIIELTNAEKLPYQLGHNEFSHMSLDEFRDYMHLGLGRSDPIEPATFIHEAPTNKASIPDSVDWSTQGAVTPVKDQGQCGSCWSFSATGALEGAYYLKNGNLKSYSEQHLVSCDTTDSGCNGGLMDNAFAWAKSNGGLCLESDYVYTSGTSGKSGSCEASSCSKDTGIAPKSYTDVQKFSDDSMMSALAQQPVSIAIEADQSAFQLYKSGVLTAACGSRLDHGVLAVGYGTWTDGTDYYKVKNSWGESWGMDGYILLERGNTDNINFRGQNAGQCGILSGPPSYPNL
jgi:C1A family cysteine protease